ncbi:hypothetical protein EUGRSUZ_H02296 [Eucalyptus grandis]|uniref:Uncharacterized protein n=2 Tax=Eucalyptus grandis TaxID=71139 RepID=A0ACC3JTJ9_EUCGR|nr:hypothetical protein EUGRSUZ_H02296 [Eucalyptus grandis]
MAFSTARLYATVASRKCCLPLSSTLIPSNTSHSENLGSTGPISKIGFTCRGVGPIGVRSCEEVRNALYLSSKKPLISIAPQKEISPSP